MNDLISKSYILNIIEMWMRVPSYSESERNIMRAIDYEIRSAPSAETKEGKWIAYKGMQPPEFHGLHYCSNCYHSLHLASNGKVYNYCPCCGAKMEESEK